MSEHLVFETLEVVSADGEVLVELEYIGEGWDGDYDPEDPEDQPLLRYTLYRKYHQHLDETKLSQICEADDYEEDDWMAVIDGSYCTMLPADANRDALRDAARMILYYVHDALLHLSPREKRLFERLSWTGLGDAPPHEGHSQAQPCTCMAVMTT